MIIDMESLSDKEAFLDWLRNEIERDGTQRATAERFGISPQYLNDILQGHRTPGEISLAMMGWRRVVGYALIPREKA